MNELISIVVPVYNVERYLDACMISILDQTYSNIEIILVDDGATDNSGKMCDHYSETDERVKVIHKENGGLSEARNKGIPQAKGEYIMFIDSDDVVSLDFVEYLYNLLKDSSADIAICDPVHGYSGKKIIFEPETLRKIFESEDAIAEMLYQKSFLVTAWGKLYRKEYFNEIIFPYGMLFEDSAVIYKIFDKAKKIVYGNAKLYAYIHREGSITTKKFSKKDCDILTISEEIMGYMSHRSERLQKAARSYYVTANLRVYLGANPYEEYEKVIHDCKTNIMTCWLKVFADGEIRRKLRISLILLFAGRKNLMYIHSKINRWA